MSNGLSVYPDAAGSSLFCQHTRLGVTSIRRVNISIVLFYQIDSEAKQTEFSVFVASIDVSRKVMQHLKVHVDHNTSTKRFDA